MSKKPCIQCGTECDILPIELGDIFTLTYLRICSAECMFLVAYDYLYQISHHKAFRAYLYDKQDADDKAERDAWIEKITEESLNRLRESLAANPDLLSAPIASGFFSMLEESVLPPKCSSQTMRFSRPPKEERIRWAKEYVEQMKGKLREALEELDRLENA